MAPHPDDRIEELAQALSELPGLGPKSAARLVSELLVRRPALASRIAELLAAAAEASHPCPGCHTLTTGDLCPICADPARDPSLVCVVETPADVAQVEATYSYRGRYFVLMGRVNPFEGMGPEELGAPELVKRASDGVVKEVVIATSYTAEGETTAHLLTDALRRKVPSVRVTRLAKGLPSGVEVEYTDPVTLSAAFMGRTSTRHR